VGCVIHAVTPYGREGPSSRVRVFEWLDRVSEPYVLSSYISHRNAAPAHLLRHPVAVLAAERRLRGMASDRARRLLLHKEASPLSRGGIERRLLSTSEFAVYDFDDALQWDTGEGGLYRRWAPKAPKALLAAQLADRVIAGNPILADWATQHNSDVIVIPSCVAPDYYRRKSDYGVGDPPRIGWIGSANQEVQLRLVSPALQEVHRRTGARLTLIGTRQPRLGDLESLIDRVEWSEAVQHDLLAEFDVAIFPLASDAYSRGKCGYKLLQYGAAGTPAVASPVGVNEQILFELGLPAATGNDEWVDAILELLTAPADERAEMGRRAREVTAERYSYDAWLPQWRRAVGLGV
jgi:glycosyltransferase involved in cell wall biosynthesis